MIDYGDEATKLYNIRKVKVIYIIFKRKTMPKIANKHGVVFAVQQKGWMDENIMKIWIEKVWRSRIGGLGRRRSLLVLDSFETHKTEQVKRSFRL